MPVSQRRRTPPVSRRGLLLGAGALAAAALAAGAWRWRRAERTQLPASIAVLPFKPLLAESRNEAIEIGIAELLINRLSVLPGVVVTPLSSVRRFSAVDQDPLQAGRDLDVEAVVEGTVQIQREQVRLTARLLDVADGRSLWAGDFTEKLGDFFALQDALVTQLVAALAVEVPAEVRERLVAHTTTDTEAWQLYANGRYQLQRRDPEAFQRAMQFFEAAIERDPAIFARHHRPVRGLGAVGHICGRTAVVRVPAGAVGGTARARDCAAVAGSTHRAGSRADPVRPRLVRRPAAVPPGPVAGAEFGLDARVHVAEPHCSRGSSRRRRSTSTVRSCSSPRRCRSWRSAAFVRYHSREFDAARQRLSGIVESAPEAVLPRQFLARVLLAQGDAAGALRLLEGRNKPAPGSYSTLGRAYAKVGNVDAARAEIARVEAEGAKGFGVGFDLALLHLALGERERALDALERAPADRSQMVGYINVEPALDPIRDEPRLRAVARAVGLPDAPAARR